MTGVRQVSRTSLFNVNTQENCMRFTLWFVVVVTYEVTPAMPTMTCGGEMDLITILSISYLFGWSKRQNFTLHSGNTVLGVLIIRRLQVVKS